MGIQAQRWTDTRLPEHGHDLRAPRRDFRELAMDIVQQTLDACESGSYKIDGVPVDCPNLAERLKDVQGQEFYEGVGATMRGGLLPSVQCRSLDRTGERMRTWMVITHL